MNLTPIIEARWFPTVSRPVVAGLLTSGLVYGLHALGVTSFEPNQLNAVTTPLAGFLVTMVVDYPNRKKPAPDAPAGPSLSKQMEDLAVQVAHEELDNNPELLKELALKGLQSGLFSTPAPPAPESMIITAPPSDPGVIR